MSIPVSLLNDLELAPRDRPVTLLMRHSARFPIIDPEDPYTAVLTAEGVRLAEELGQLLGPQFRPGRMLSAPVDRCIKTGEAIARGAGWQVNVQTDERISHPFMVPAWRLIERGELNGVLPFPVQAAMPFMLREPDYSPRLNVMVTHDSVLGAIVGCLLRAPVLGPEHWPGYLEGLFVWRADDRIHILWRGEAQVFTGQLVKVT